MGQRHLRLRAVARRQEGGRGHRHHHRIAHEDRGVGLPDRAVGPGQRHDPQFAVEVGKRHRHGRATAFVQRHRTREPRHQLFRGRRRLRLHGPRVAPRPDRAIGGPAGQDQPSIDIAQRDPKPALAEVVPGRGRRRVAGQIQDALVHRPDRRLHGLPRGRALDGERDLHLAARIDLGRGGQGGADRAVGRIDRRGRDPQRADRRVGGDRRAVRPAAGAGRLGRAGGEGADGADGDIGTGAPFLGHRQVHGVAARRHRHDPQVDHPVRQHRHDRHAVGRRVQRGARGVARAVGGLVQRDLQPVGGVGPRARRAPARLERDRGRDAVGAGHDQLVPAPVHRHRQGGRAGGGEVQRAVRRARAAGDGLIAPVAADGVPLIVGLDPVQHPFGGARAQGQVGVQRDHLERGVRPLGHHRVEAGADSQRAAGGHDQPLVGPLDRAARAFAHGQRQARVERLRRLRQRGRQVDPGGKAALGVGRPGRHRHDLGRGIVVVAAELEAVEPGQRARRGQPQLALDRKAGGGRAEQPAGGDVSLDRLARGQGRVGQGKVEGDPLGPEILDQHVFRGERGTAFLDPEVDAPDAARGGVGDRHVKDVAPGTGGRGHQPRVFDPVGADHHGGQRQAVDRLRALVAGHDGGVRDLARAVGAAVGRHEHVDGRRGRRALDPPVRQVELGVQQRHEGHVGRRAGSRVAAALHQRRHDRRLGRAGAAHQPRVEAGDPLVVGPRRAQHRVPARQQLHRHPGAGARVRQAAHHDRHPVAARIARKPEVRDHEPLGRGRAAIGRLARHRRRQRIDARTERPRRLPQVEPRRHLGIDRMGAAAGRGRDIGVAAPHLLPHVRREGPGLPVVQRGGEDLVRQRPDEVAVGHAVQGQIDAVRVHGPQGQALIARGGQQIGAAAEARLRIAVADVKRQVHRARQHLAVLRRQARPQGQPQRLPAGQAGDAQLAALRLDRHRRVGQRDEGAVVGGVCQRIGKDDAGARVGGVGIDAAVADAEAVAFLKPFDQRGEFGVAAATRLRGLAQRGKPVGATVQPLGQFGPQFQRGGAVAGIAKPRVGRGVQRGRQRLAVVVGGIGRVAHRGGKGEPVVGAVRRGGRGAEPAHPPGLVARKARVGGRLA